MLSPKVSIIVPVYNIEQHIEKCLLSIMTQTLADIEIIAVNDGSTDDSLGIIQKLAKDDKRIVVINKVNGGLSSARNAGIEVAKGEYIANIDGDDWVERGYLEATYSFAKNNKNDMVITDLFIESGVGALVEKKDIDFGDAESISGAQCVMMFFEKNGNHSVCNKLVKKSLYQAYRVLHPEHISMGEDLATMPRLMYYAKSVGKLNNAYYHYVKREASITGTKNERNVRDVLAAFEVLENFFVGESILLELAAYQTRHLAIDYIYDLDIANDNAALQDAIKKYLMLNSRYKTIYKSKKLQYCSWLLKIFPYETLVLFLRYVQKILKGIF